MLGNWTKGIGIKELNWITYFLTKVLCLFLEYKRACSSCAFIFLYKNELRCRGPPPIHFTKMK